MSSKQITTPRQDSWLEGLPMLVLVLVLLLAMILGGCGQPAAQPSDQGEGRKALQAVLDAWKGGAKPDALAQQVPPIHASDGDWKSGQVLQDYRADDEGKLVGSDLNYSVVLELKNPKGKVTKKTAVYTVTTHPQLLVHRQDN
jgi:hypothetical protein